MTHTYRSSCMVTELRLSRRKGRDVLACRGLLLRQSHVLRYGETARVGSSRDNYLNRCRIGRPFLLLAVSRPHLERVLSPSLPPHHPDVSIQVLASVCPFRTSCYALLAASCQ